MKIFTKNVLFIIVFYCIKNIAFSQVEYKCGGYSLALNLNGTGTSFVLSKSYAGTQSITLTAWVRFAKSPIGKISGIIYRDAFGTTVLGKPTREHWGLFTNATGQFVFKALIDVSSIHNSSKTKEDSLTSGVVADTGVWYHIAATLNAADHSCDIYVNGNLVNSKTMQGPLAYGINLQSDEHYYTIGSGSQIYHGSFSTFNYFNGYIDDAGVAGASLTKAQIDSLANNEYVLNQYPPALYIYDFFRFEEGFGTQTKNYGNAHPSSGWNPYANFVKDVQWKNWHCGPSSAKLINPFPAVVDTDGHIINNIKLIDTTQIVKGLATDSVSKLIVYLKATDGFDFVLDKNVSNGTLSYFDDEFIKTDSIRVFPKDGIIAFLYNSPDGYGEQYTLGGRDILLKVRGVNDPNQQFTISIRLMPAPVVLVHGMWTNPQVWEISTGTNPSFLKYLMDAGFTNIQRADYSNENYTTWDPADKESIFGRTAVYKAINEGIIRYKYQGIISCQVDVIGHSLGGLMTRSFSQWKEINFVRRNYKKGFIHKLISLGTPHLGSPLGPFLYDFTNPIRLPGFSFKALTLRYVMEYILKQKIGSCLRDFDPKSSAYRNLAATNLYNINKVFAVVGIASAVQSSAMNDFLYALGATSTEKIFGDLNDLIVSRKSQLGGLVSSGTDDFQFTAHSEPPGKKLSITYTETNNPLIFSKVAQLLKTGNPSFFAPNFPAPVDAMNGRKGIINKNLSYKKLIPGITSNQTIKIDSLSRNLSFVAGKLNNIKIIYDSSENSKLNTPICMIQDLGWFSFDSSNKINVTIPENTTGRVNFAILARDSDGSLVGDTASFEIVPNGTFIKLQVSPSDIELDSIIRQQTLQATSIYKIGIDTIAYYLKDGTGISYKSLHNKVSINEKGIVQAVAKGIDTIFVTYLTDTLKIPVIVDSNFSGAKLYTNHIDFPPIDNKTLDDSTFGLIASAASGEDVDFKVVSGPAKIKNSVVILTGTGTVTIQAAASGNAYFANAVPVERSFVVTNALPVTLLNFSALLYDNKVKLEWQTAQEENTSYFIIERSTDGIKFDAIGTVNAKGNSSIVSDYSFIDDTVNQLNFAKIYYRLNEVDKDSKSSLSKTVFVKINNKIVSLLLMPNPVKANLSLRLINYTGKIKVQIYDMSGKMVYDNDLNQSNSNTNINTSSLNAGTYLIRVNANKVFFQQKFVKQ